MKKNKAHAGTKLSKQASPRKKGTKKPVDLAEIRQQITNLVGNDAVRMVEITMDRGRERPLSGNEAFVRDDRALSRSRRRTGPVIPNLMAAVLRKTSEASGTAGAGTGRFRRVVTKDLRQAAVPWFQIVQGLE